MKEIARKSLYSVNSKIITRASDFRDFFEKKPDVYVIVYGPEGKQLLYSTEDKIRRNIHFLLSRNKKKKNT